MERVSKKPKHVIDVDALPNVEEDIDGSITFNYLTKTYPQYQFRLKNGKVYRQTRGGANWYKVCIHNIPTQVCKSYDCKGGYALCIHNTEKMHCRQPGCKYDGLCRHGIFLVACWDELCKAYAQRQHCLHGVKRAVCWEPECWGGTAYCIKCETKHKAKDGYCLTCHPDYIPYVPGFSKVACAYLCQLEAHLGVKIQHVRYDRIAQTTTGSEYVIPGWRNKRVDGFYVDANGSQIVVEFLGDIFHGHPSRWGANEQNRDPFGRLHKTNFYNTEDKLAKLFALGYTVYYVWEKDYRAIKALQSPAYVLRKFKDKLEH